MNEVSVKQFNLQIQGVETDFADYGKVVLCMEKQKDFEKVAMRVSVNSVIWNLLLSCLNWWQVLWQIQEQ